MQFSVRMELYGKCMTSIFPYLEIVWVVFFGHPGYVTKLALIKTYLHAKKFQNNFFVYLKIDDRSWNLLKKLNWTKTFKKCLGIWKFPIITRPNCALDRRTVLSLYTPGFQRQVLKVVKFCRIDKRNWKNKGSVLLAESAYNLQKTQLYLYWFDWNEKNIAKSFVVF